MYVIRRQYQGVSAIACAILEVVMFMRKIRLRQEGKEYTYLKVVENVRQKGRPVQKTLVNFGNVSHWPDDRIVRLIELLNRFLGRSLPEGEPFDLESVRVESCRQLGPYLPLDRLWDGLGMDAILDALLAKRKLDPRARECIKVMVLTRLVWPRSKRWVWEMAAEQAHIPGVDAQSLPLHLYYRSLTFLSEVQTQVEQSIHHNMTHLFNRDVSLVFYDLTSVYFEGTQCKKAKHGYSREHRPDLLQIEIGLMVDAEGMPIGHEVFDGNIKDVSTVLGALERLKKTFAVKRCVFVGDDGMASRENLAAIDAAGYEYVTSLSLGKSKIGQELLWEHRTPWRWKQLGPTMHLALLRPAGGGDGQSYIGTYNPLTARTTRRHRSARLRQCQEFLEKLREPPKPRSRKRSPEQIVAAAQGFVNRKKAQEFIRLEACPKQGFTWSLDRDALRRARRQDGVMILVTNTKTLSPEEVARGYRTLWRVEDAFRHMKDGLRLRPIRHWNDARVLGHVFVCVLAYLLECLYDRALEQAGQAVSARTALDRLSTLTVATLSYQDRQVRRRSEITAEQRKLLAAAHVDQVPAVW
jgi:hypothetical protein